MNQLHPEPVNLFKRRWLASVLATPELSERDKRVAAVLADALEGSGTTVHRSWHALRRDLNLPNHAVVVHLATLARVGFVGDRIRQPAEAAGWPLLHPWAEPKQEPSVNNSTTRADLEARNAQRAEARRSVDRLADAKWIK